VGRRGGRIWWKRRGSSGTFRSSIRKGNRREEIALEEEYVHMFCLSHPSRKRNLVGTSWPKLCVFRVVEINRVRIEILN